MQRGRRRSRSGGHHRPRSCHGLLPTVTEKQPSSVTAAQPQSHGVPASAVRTVRDNKRVCCVDRGASIEGRKKGRPLPISDFYPALWRSLVALVISVSMLQLSSQTAERNMTTQERTDTNARTLRLGCLPVRHGRTRAPSLVLSVSRTAHNSLSHFLLAQHNHAHPVRCRGHRRHSISTPRLQRPRALSSPAAGAGRRRPAAWCPAPSPGTQSGPWRR